jgi:hypothetical protein
VTPLTVEDVATAVTDLGGLVAILDRADAADRAELYEALDVGARYDAATHTVVLEVEPAWGQLRVGGGTCGLSPRATLHRTVLLAA